MYSAFNYTDMNKSSQSNIKDVGHTKCESLQQSCFAGRQKQQRKDKGNPGGERNMLSHPRSFFLSLFRGYCSLWNICFLFLSSDDKGETSHIPSSFSA